MRVKISFFQGLHIVSYLKEAIPKVVEDKKVTLAEAIEVITTVFAMLGIDVMKEGVKVK